MVDNRMSDLSFVSGMLSKIVMELVMRYGLNYSTSFTSSFNHIGTGFSTGSAYELGKGIQLLIGKLVNFEGPKIRYDKSQWQA